MELNRSILADEENSKPLAFVQEEERVNYTILEVRLPADDVHVESTERI